MKTVKNLDPDSMFKELKESWRIETKMLMTTKPLSAKEIEFLKAKAEEGSPHMVILPAGTVSYIQSRSRRLGSS